jgi:hypothetical protein
MLNNVLRVLNDKEYDFFKGIGKDKTLAFITLVIKIGNYEDCNSGEILDELGEKLGICYDCLNYADNIEDHGLCHKCLECC